MYYLPSCISFWSSIGFHYPLRSYDIRFASFAFSVYDSYMEWCYEGTSFGIVMGLFFGTSWANTFLDIFLGHLRRIQHWTPAFGFIPAFSFTR